MASLRCGICDSSTHVFLELGASPPANRLPATKEEPEQYFPLRLAKCLTCNHVQLADAVPDSVLFDESYAFYSSGGNLNQPYWDSYANDLATMFTPDGTLLEIGCNDGTLTTRLQDRGFDCVGIDPSGGPASLMREDIPVVVMPFGTEAARHLRDNFKSFDLVVANNVLAHVSDLRDFMNGLRLVTHDKSTVVVEVQYLADLVAGNQFDHVYHEHRSFFSVYALKWLFEMHGWSISSVQWTPAQGGSIRVFANRGGISKVADWLARERWVHYWGTLETIQGRIDRVVDLTKELVDGFKRKDLLVAGYGASAKMVTFLNYSRISNLDWVVDATPWKQGRFIPGVKTKILAPEEEPCRPDVYLVGVWNYMSGILRRETKFMADGGKFLVPIPHPVIL